MGAPEIRNGIVWLQGHIDGTLTPAVLPPTVDPVIVNFRRVSGINSDGVPKFLEFLNAFGNRKFEFHDCPVELLVAFSVLPALLGPESNTAKIISFYVPHHCGRCGDELNLIVKTNELRVKGSLLIHAHELTLDADKCRLPPRACPRCGEIMRADPSTFECVVDLIGLSAIEPNGDGFSG